MSKTWSSSGSWATSSNEAPRSAQIPRSALWRLTTSCGKFEKGMGQRRPQNETSDT